MDRGGGGGGALTLPPYSRCVVSAGNDGALSHVEAMGVTLVVEDSS